MKITHYGFNFKRKSGDMRKETWCYCGEKYAETFLQDWEKVTCKKCQRKRAQVQNKVFEDAKKEKSAG